MRMRKAAALVLCWGAFAALPAPAQSRVPAVLDAKFQAAVRDAEAGLDGVLGLALDLPQKLGADPAADFASLFDCAAVLRKQVRDALLVLHHKGAGRNALETLFQAERLAPVTREVQAAVDELRETAF